MVLVFYCDSQWLTAGGLLLSGVDLSHHFLLNDHNPQLFPIFQPKTKYTKAPFTLEINFEIKFNIYVNLFFWKNNF